jgi:alanyl-tRNA synthetase
MSDQLMEKLESVVLLLASENNGKVSFIVVVTADYVQKGINADKIAKAFASEINGSSGGTHSFAQGGSKDLSRLSEVIKIAHQFIK